MCAWISLKRCQAYLLLKLINFMTFVQMDVALMLSGCCRGNVKWFYIILCDSFGKII